MNKNLKPALKNRSSEQGFAIPIAVGMGLIMVLVGATMIVRSQGDQVTASAQKATARSLSTTETAITRVQAFLKEYPYFTKFPSTQWNDTNVINGAADAYIETARCTTPISSATARSNIQTSLNSLLPGWKPIDTADSYKGEFNIQSYVYNTPNGILTIAGKNPQEAYTNLQVTIPIQEITTSNSRPPGPPGLWLNKSNLTSNQTVSGNLLLNGCSDDNTAPKNLDGTSSPTRQSDMEPGGTFTVSTSTKLPKSPSLPNVVPTFPTILLGTLTQDYYIGRYNPDSGSATSLPSTLPTAADIITYPNGTQRDGSYAYRLSSITSDLTIAAGKKVTK